MLTAPRISSRFTQLLLLAAILSVLTIVFYTNADAIHVPESISLKPPTKGRPHHPIDDLIEEAERQQDALLQKESHTLADAVRAYEERRGRRPPPGFDVWFHFAQDNNALVIEDFFDRIYHDLNPFWAVPALTIRQQAGDIFHRISIRNGSTSQLSDQRRVWLDLWENLIGTIAQHLPDLDIPINVMDESRVVVPWETIDEYMTVEGNSRRIVPASEVVHKFGKTSVGKDEEVPGFDPQWEGGPYWDRAVIGCHPDSPARSYKAEVDYTVFPPLNNSYPEKSHHGYVANWTYVKQPCEHPQLQGLHGTFVEPISISNSRKLMPLFGGSKLPMNNEILLPPAMYWTDDPFYSGGEEHGTEWGKKKNKIIWRGAASGGRNKDTTWARFQRHRFVSMVNGTSIAHAEETGKQPNFELPESGQYDLPSGSLAEWVSEWGDAAFVH
ncbi:glycosyltransferase family 90 protein, partial [Aureobasidium melanogenum]